MANNTQPRQRCAVYTRKSSDEGLEQSFNSLDAQHEACEAYIRSQKHEGWRSTGARYDDGGYSGGSMERPGLQRLLADIEGGKIDIIVVYKVDRLTRSLMDFAKMVEMFDRKGVSFVSVTQQFSTTTSMGRLTLNMLLSFAQFEREVTGERIRDKIAASKRKGLWMGGLPPLGYDPDERTLKINETEAATVRTIFDLYRKFGNVKQVKEEADRLLLRTKRREWSNGKISGGESFSRGHIYQILENPIYAGMIAHKGELFPGQHTPIIDQVTWDAVRAQILDQAPPRRQQPSSSSRSLLTGLIFDEQGQRLTPTFACKGSKRYRYYVSNELVTDGKARRGFMRIPAQELDTIAVDALQTLLRDRAQLLEILPTTPWAADMFERGADLAEDLYDVNKRPSIIGELIARATVSSTQLRLSVAIAALTTSLSGQPIVSSTETVELSVPVKFLRRNGELRLIIPKENGEPTAAPDPLLVRTVLRAQSWLSHLVAGGTVKQIALANRITTSFVSRTVRLAFLAPDITESILDGKQPSKVTVTRLLADSEKLPFGWPEQRQILGYPPLRMMAPEASGTAA